MIITHIRQNTRVSVSLALIIIDWHYLLIITTRRASRAAVGASACRTEAPRWKQALCRRSFAFRDFRFH